MALLLRPPVFQLVNSAGQPYAGGSLEFYLTGTSTHIVASSFGSLVTGQIITDNGVGEFTVTQPPTDCGWIAYVQDEDRYYSFIANAWVPSSININGLEEDTSPDATADFVGTYDNSASAHKKVKPTNLTADSGASRTVIPAHCGQRSGDRGQFLTNVQA